MRGTQIFGLLLFTVAAVGCGGGSGDGDDDGTAVDAPVGDPDGSIPADYTRLIGRTWTLAAGQADTYRCIRLTVPEDTYITNIMAQAPLGTHHTVLSIATGSRVAGADGEYNCRVSDLGTVMLYASGVGTSPLDFPAGVGIKIAAGTQIHLNLHLYNAGDTELSGESSLMVKASATPPPMLAEMVFAGGFGFSIPANTPPTDPYEYTSGCTVDTPYNLFAVWPHMHQYAVHQKVEFIRDGASTTLHDLAYSFAEQKYYRKDPIVAIQAGDQIRVTCSWINTTGSSLGFGDSSDTEMCFAGLYRYPAANTNLFRCTDTGGIGF